MISKNELKRLTALAREAQRVIDSIDPQVIAAVQEFARTFEQRLQTYLPLVKGVIEQAQNWQSEQKISVADLAERGWFPNWFTFISDLEEEHGSEDEMMIAQIEQNWEELKDHVISFCPNREHILKTAFELHEAGNYTASVPLLLIQSDGICAEEFTYFFSADRNTGKRASDEIVQQVADGTLSLDFIGDILLEPFKVKLQLTQGSSKSSFEAKSKGPNRHGILHGSRKHLDYGSRVNGYKAISFLAFLVYTTKDQFKGLSAEL